MAAMAPRSEETGKPQSSAVQPQVPMSDVGDEYDWENWDNKTPFWQHAMAGSCAGVMEHVSMYPMDTVKTRIQATQGVESVSKIFRSLLQERGVLGLMRGSTVIGVGCIPAHIGLFGTYEFSKSWLLDMQDSAHQPMRAAACGGAATIVHDAIITPMDVVKQRLQLGSYVGTFDCIRSTWRHEGFLAFYRSLPTTLAMNIPYMGLLVATNESLKKVLQLGGAGSSPAGEDIFAGAPWYFFCAGLSGAFAAIVTLPLDVVKTRLQTQGLESHLREGAAAPSKPRYRGILSTMNKIAEEEGARGFFRGLGPRVALALPSAAVCWGTYETIRMVLSSYLPATACEAKLPPELPPQRTTLEESLEWEEWDRSTPFWQHAVAGSAAGVMEHVAMYPVDTVKTRMQAEPVRLGQAPPTIAQTVRVVLQEQGASGFMRGCFAIGFGCIPAHIGLFCTYECAKARLMDVEKAQHQPVRAATCGALATVVHDMIITPTDVVKQRLQLGRYTGIADCVGSVLRHEGPMAFYRSLPTTLISECPFHGVLVATNESLKVFLGLDKRCEGAGQAGTSVGWHFFSTGLSGLLAAVVTQPLDVVKTRIQTQNVSGAADVSAVSTRYSGMLPTAMLIVREEGLPGFFRGTVPRMLFAAPSAAMCWGTYEVIKALLRGSSSY